MWLGQVFGKIIYSCLTVSLYMNFLTALNHVKHCCYMPIAWQCQALIESFCHRGQTQSWWGALRKQSFLLLRTNTSMTACTHWATQFFGLGQSECGVTIRHIGRTETVIACTECPSVLCTRGSWEIFQITSQSSVYSCKKGVLRQLLKIFSTHTRKNGLP